MADYSHPSRLTRGRACRQRHIGPRAGLRRGTTAPTAVVTGLPGWPECGTWTLLPHTWWCPGPVGRFGRACTTTPDWRCPAGRTPTTAAAIRLDTARPGWF